jgi:hypothetical protein
MRCIELFHWPSVRRLRVLVFFGRPSLLLQKLMWWLLLLPPGVR